MATDHKELLLECRAYIDRNSTSYSLAKRDILDAIDAALNEPAAQQVPCYSESSSQATAHKASATPARNAGEDKADAYHRVPTSPAVAAGPLNAKNISEYFDVPDILTKLSNLWRTLLVRQLAKYALAAKETALPQVSYIDRSEAVNLATNYLDFFRKNNIELSVTGATKLANAVLSMDAYIKALSAED